MKKLLKVGDGLALIEQAINDCKQRRVECPECHHAIVQNDARVSTKLAAGLQFNLDAVAGVLASARSALHTTPAMEKYEVERVRQMQRMSTSTEAERVEAVLRLQEQHQQAMLDMADYRKADLEVGAMEYEVDLYRVPLSWVPGWFADDCTDQAEIDRKNAVETIPFSSISVLLRFGVLYDPTLEDKDGNPVEDKAGKAGKATPEAK